jgi:hypothetical protein
VARGVDRGGEKEGGVITPRPPPLRQWCGGRLGQLLGSAPCQMRQRQQLRPAQQQEGGGRRGIDGRMSSGRGAAVAGTATTRRGDSGGGRRTRDTGRTSNSPCWIRACVWDAAVPLPFLQWQMWRQLDWVAGDNSSGNGSYDGSCSGEQTAMATAIAAAKTATTVTMVVAMMVARMTAMQRR